MLNGMGIDTGLNLKEIIKVSWFISDYLKRSPKSRVTQTLGRK